MRGLRTGTRQNDILLPETIKFNGKLPETVKIQKECNIIVTNIGYQLKDKLEPIDNS